VFGVGPPAPSDGGPAGGLGMGMWYSAEIIERPHNGTAVLRADGRSGYYYPKPGFTGNDSMRVRSTGCNFFGTWHASAFNNWCGSTTRTIFINVLPAPSYPSQYPNRANQQLKDAKAARATTQGNAFCDNEFVFAIPSAFRLQRVASRKSTVCPAIRRSGLGAPSQDIL
jgi:hypothetical protein